MSYDINHCHARSVMRTGVDRAGSHGDVRVVLWCHIWSRAVSDASEVELVARTPHAARARRALMLVSALRRLRACNRRRVARRGRGERGDGRGERGGVDLVVRAAPPRAAALPSSSAVPHGASRVPPRPPPLLHTSPAVPQTSGTTLPLHCFIPFHSIPFHSIPLHTGVPCVAFHSIPLYITLHYITDLGEHTPRHRRGIERDDVARCTDGLASSPL